MEKKLLGVRPEVNENIKKSRKYFLGVGLSLAILGAGAVGWHHFTNEAPEVEIIDINEIERGFPHLVNLQTIRPVIYVDGVDVAGMTRNEQKRVIATHLELMGQKKVTANYGDTTLTTTLNDLGIQLAVDLETLLDELEILEYELDRKSAFELRFPSINKLEFTYSDERVEWWTQTVAGQLNIAPVEPSLRMTSRGNFTTTEGRTGRRVLTHQLQTDVAAVLQDLTQPDLSVDIITETTNPVRSASLLASVDTRIAYATSTFSRAEAGRAGNVDRGAQLINGALLMPGEEFSFNNLVYPVTPANGFGYGTIFMHGQPAQGIGGGLCQVSSTLYWAQLRTGILATRRQAHSRPVFYVPRGLDATMFIGLIDYRFVNTLDYPLYVNAFTQGGTLTVEFWSSSRALNGLSFEPRTERVATTASTKSYDTFLRTYNASGQLISEQFIHRSTYNTD